MNNKLADIDKLDRQILSILMKDAKTPYTDIAKQLYVSGGTIHVRMKKLEQMGIVKGANLTVDYAELGYEIINVPFGTINERTNFIVNALACHL